MEEMKYTRDLMKIYSFTNQDCFQTSNNSFNSFQHVFTCVI